MTTMIMVRYIAAGFLVATFAVTGCNKDKCKSGNGERSVFDTIVELKFKQADTRVLFSDGQFVDVKLGTWMEESRCPNCLITGSDSCPYQGMAKTQLIVKNEVGDSLRFLCSFRSCLEEFDTIGSSPYSAPPYYPFSKCIIWPLSLKPYPTYDMPFPGTSNSVLKLHIQKVMD